MCAAAFPGVGRHVNPVHGRVYEYKLTRRLFMCGEGKKRVNNYLTGQGGRSRRFPRDPGDRGNPYDTITRRRGEKENKKKNEITTGPRVTITPCRVYKDHHHQPPAPRVETNG